jgi:uncharacterized transporter YbjL
MGAWQWREALFMLSIISLLVIITLSILVTRIATVALTLTGLSKESARFQARSAFTGVGFTTAESEEVVNHPVRRRILLLLMLLGNVGIVSAMSSLILSFLRNGEAVSMFWRMALLFAGVALLWVVAVSPWVDRRLSRIISWALSRYTRVEVRDLSRLLNLSGEYSVTELQVQPTDWLAEQTLEALKLRDEGVLILGILRKEGAYLGAPNGGTKIQPGDTLILYGRSRALDRLDERRKGAEGDLEHEEASREQEGIEASERIREAEQDAGEK